MIQVEGFIAVQQPQHDLFERANLREGRKHQIRRVLRAVGVQVAGLERVRVGSLELGDLPAGSWRFLEKSELDVLIKR